MRLNLAVSESERTEIDAIARIRHTSLTRAIITGIRLLTAIHDLRMRGYTICARRSGDPAIIIEPL